MSHATGNADNTKQAILARVRALVPSFASRAAVAEEARCLPPESAREMLEAGLARILMPPRFGGYGLGFDAWFDVVQAISKADASHGWCAGLIIHHAHLVAQFPAEAQQAVWAAGPDVAVAASFMPTTQVARVPGGYRVSGENSAFASGVGHSAWVIVGGFARENDAPEWLFFLIPPGEYAVRDTWFTNAMRGTGSNTIVTANVFVPDGRVLRLSDLRDGKGPGGAINESPIFHTPFFYYAPIGFVAPMLGAAQGAYEHFRDWTKTRKAARGEAVAEKVSVQVRMARAAADLDAAELLLRRAVDLSGTPQAFSPTLLARSVRDFARVAELTVGAADTLIALSGTAGFASAHPIQRAWRDVHFAAMHISINAETNLAHFGRIELGLGRDPSLPFF